MVSKNGSEAVLKRLGRVIALTRIGLFSEAVTKAFWPVWTVLIVALAALMSGLHDALPLEVTWAVGVLLVLAFAYFAVLGARRFHVPSRQQAVTRLDATLPGRPLQALQDVPAIGHDDPASQRLWQAHQARMTIQTENAKAVPPNLQVSHLDPFGIRHIALLFLMVGMVFGSFANIGTVKTIASPGGAALASGPAWEGWVESPVYTGKPAIYLNDQPAGQLILPEGSKISLRLYGEVGALTVAETVSGQTGSPESAASAQQVIEIAQSGTLEISGLGGAVWNINVVPDRAPTVMAADLPGTSGRGEMTLPFDAADDYGIVSGTAHLALDLEAVERVFGLSVAPEHRADVVVQLPLPVSRDRAYFQEVLIEDFSEHVWAHLPVQVILQVKDESGLTGQTNTLRFALPARRFFDPLASAIIELRRDLLWSKQNGARVAQLMRAVSHRPEDGIFRRETDYLRFRTILRRLETNIAYGLNDTKRDELAQALWDLATNIEDGILGNAAERLRQAQERLSEAMKNGASDSEIAQLMQELRDASEAYLRELARRDRQQGEGQEGQNSAQSDMQLNQNDLQRMMDRIQELMEQGRMAEAQQALEELQRLMENMRVTQGEGQQNPGEQAMEGLADTLREQQGLSDEAFRELQEQFNPDVQSGQSQENQGFNGGEGRGQAHDGTGENSGSEDSEGGGRSQPQQRGQTETLEQRQRALREELNRQRDNLPGQGSPEGEAAREALGQAEGAMEGAEEALRQDDLARAIDRQAEALDALREGLRSLGEAMSQEQQDGQQGNAEAQGSAQDPLGRSQGARGPAGTEEGLLQGEDAYRHARRLLDEIRRRSGDTERPVEERNYLERLLERF